VIFVAIELRRLLIGDPYGDYNFLRFPGETGPELLTYNDYYWAKEGKWFREGDNASFLGGLKSLHARYVRVYGTTVSHFAPTFSCGAVARFGLGGSSQLGGSFILANPYSEISVTNLQNYQYYELRQTNPAQGRWRVSVRAPLGYQQDLDEIRLWEFIDIEPYLEDMIPADADTEVFQMPMGRYFVGTHYRWTAKRLTITLLFSRTETTLRKQLEGFLTKPSPRYPLELFIDNYLFRCAPASLRFEPVGGIVIRAVIELQLLLPYGYHQDRTISDLEPVYPSNSYPMQIYHEVGGSVETPCEIRIAPGSAYNGFKIRITVAPSGQKVIYTMAGDEYGKVISFQEDGRVLLAWRGASTSVTDVTERLDISSQVPFVLHPGMNVISVEYLDPNDNPIADTYAWGIAIAYNKRVGEVVGL